MHEKKLSMESQKSRIPDPLQLNTAKTVAVYGDVFYHHSKGAFMK